MMYWMVLFELYKHPSLAIKTLTHIMLGAMFSPILFFVEKYIFNDWQMAIAIGVTLGFDAIVGLYKHWRLKTLSRSGFDKFFDKFIKYAVTLVLLHILKTFILKSSGTVVQWIDAAVYGAIFASIALSILENFTEFGSDKFPPKVWVQRLQKYTETNNAADLKPNIQEVSNN